MGGQKTGGIGDQIAVALSPAMACRPQLEILGPVVIADAINVVDGLLGRERTTEYLLHDDAMLGNKSLPIPQNPVAMPIGCRSSAIEASALARTKTLPVRIRAVRVFRPWLLASTVETGELRHNSSGAVTLRRTVPPSLAALPIADLSPECRTAAHADDVAPCAEAARFGHRTRVRHRIASSEDRGTAVGAKARCGSTGAIGRMARLADQFAPPATSSRSRHRLSPSTSMLRLDGRRSNT